MRIWEKILCLWACVAYCQNCEPNSHALRAQTVVLRSDAMRAHSRIFKQMLILSCAPAAFYVISNKKCRSKPINSFHAGGGLYLSTAFFMWHIQYSRKGSSMYNKHSVGNFVHFVSIAGRLEALFEHAKRASLVRSSDNRRRKPTNKGFSPKCASVMCTGGFRTLVNNIPI